MPFSNGFSSSSRDRVSSIFARSFGAEETEEGEGEEGEAEGAVGNFKQEASNSAQWRVSARVVKNIRVDSPCFIRYLRVSKR